MARKGFTRRQFGIGVAASAAVVGSAVAQHRPAYRAPLTPLPPLMESNSPSRRHSLVARSTSTLPSHDRTGRHAWCRQKVPQRSADHDGRCRVCGTQHVRRRDPDPGARPHRQRRLALHTVPFHGAVLADASRPDHGAQPPRRRLRRHLRSGDGFSGLRQYHRLELDDHRPHPEGQRLRHLLVR